MKSSGTLAILAMSRAFSLTSKPMVQSVTVQGSHDSQTGGASSRPRTAFLALARSRYP